MQEGIEKKDRESKRGFAFRKGKVRDFGVGSAGGKGKAKTTIVAKKDIREINKEEWMDFHHHLMKEIADPIHKGKVNKFLRKIGVILNERTSAKKIK